MSIHDGVIQRFEFCTELAWKATREYLINEKYTVNNDRGVLYANGIPNSRYTGKFKEDILADIEQALKSV